MLYLSLQDSLPIQNENPLIPKSFTLFLNVQDIETFQFRCLIDLVEGVQLSIKEINQYIANT